MFQLLSMTTLAACLFLGWLCVYRSGESSYWPRNRVVGELLGVICLVWSAQEACLMLEGGLAKYHPLVWALVPATAILSWFFLDYLLARSLGGFLVLCANALIRHAFAESVPLRGLYSVDCLFLGVLGLFLLGVPWRMRDALVWCERRPVGRKWVGGAFAFLGFLLLLSIGSR